MTEKAYIIFPDNADAMEVKYEGRNRDHLEQQFIKSGKCVITPVLDGKAHIVTSEPDDDYNTRAEWAFFAGTDDQRSADGYAADSDGILTFRGNAIIVGARNDSGLYDGVDIDLIDDRVAFTMDAMVAGEALKALREEIGAANDDFDRSHLSEDELTRCGCPSCDMEVASRKKKTGTLN